MGEGGKAEAEGGGRGRGMEVEQSVTARIECARIVHIGCRSPARMKVHARSNPHALKTQVQCSQCNRPTARSNMADETYSPWGSGTPHGNFLFFVAALPIFTVY